MRKVFNDILFVDIEATCWENKNPPMGEFSEIIEIGTCVLDVKNGHIKNGPEILIFPSNSQISKFCHNLTGLTNETMWKKGVPFIDAVRNIQEFYPDIENMTWASYGSYDITMIKQEFDRHKVKNIFSSSHVNIKDIIAIMMGWKKGVGLKRAMNRMGLEFKGRQHRGVDDAMNAALLFWEVLKRARSGGEQYEKY